MTTKQATKNNKSSQKAAKVAQILTGNPQQEFEDRLSEMQKMIDSLIEQNAQKDAVIASLTEKISGLEKPTELNIPRGWSGQKTDFDRAAIEAGWPSRHLVRYCLGTKEISPPKIKDFILAGNITKGEFVNLLVNKHGVDRSIPEAMWDRLINPEIA